MGPTAPGGPRSPPAPRVPATPWNPWADTQAGSGWTAAPGKSGPPPPALPGPSGPHGPGPRPGPLVCPSRRLCPAPPSEGRLGPPASLAPGSGPELGTDPREGPGWEGRCFSGTEAPQPARPQVGTPVPRCRVELGRRRDWGSTWSCPGAGEKATRQAAAAGPGGPGHCCVWPDPGRCPPRGAGPPRPPQGQPCSVQPQGTLASGGGQGWGLSGQRCLPWVRGGRADRRCPPGLSSPVGKGRGSDPARRSHHGPPGGTRLRLALSAAAPGHAPGHAPGRPPPSPDPAWGVSLTFGPCRPTFPGAPWRPGWPWKRTGVLARPGPSLTRGGGAACQPPHRYLQAGGAVVPLLPFDSWRTLEGRQTQGRWREWGAAGGGGGKQHLPRVPGPSGPGSLVTPADLRDPQVRSVRVARALPGDTGREGLSRPTAALAAPAWVASPHDLPWALGCPAVLGLRPCRGGPAETRQG